MVPVWVDSSEGLRNAGICSSSSSNGSVSAAEAGGIRVGTSVAAFTTHQEALHAWKQQGACCRHAAQLSVSLTSDPHCKRHHTVAQCSLMSERMRCKTVAATGPVQTMSHLGRKGHRLCWCWTAEPWQQPTCCIHPNAWPCQRLPAQEHRPVPQNVDCCALLLCAVVAKLVGRRRFCPGKIAQQPCILPADAVARAVGHQQW